MNGRRRTTLDDLLAAVCAYVADNIPGRWPRRLKLELDDGEKISHPVSTVPGTVPEKNGDDTTPLQDDILAALAGKVLATDALAAACDVDRRRLFKPGGVKELVAAGRVKNKPRRGFYTPEDPPDELAGED